MQITIQTTKHIEAIDITDEIEKSIKDKKGKAVLIFCYHTTSGLLINEPNAIQDIIEAIDEIEPKLDYQHKSNAQAHIKASLINPSILIPIEQGKIKLGQWQKIFLAEFDGPRERKINISIL